MPTTPSRPGRRLVILGVILVTLIFGITGLLISAQHKFYFAESQRRTDNLAQVLAEQTSRAVQPVDLVLREMLGRLAVMREPSTEWRSRAIFDFLVERLKGLPQADALMIVGADGQLANFSRAFPATALGASGRDYFKYFSTHDDHALFVSAPVRTFTTGQWTLILGRRINDGAGAFSGVALAAVTLSFLEDFYRAAVPSNNTVTVLRRDGMILLRYPGLGDTIGHTLPAEAPWYKIVESGGGSFRSPGYVDNTVSLVSVHPLREFPLVIDVSTAEATALSDWRRQTGFLLAGAAFASALVLVLLRIFGVQYIRLARQNTLLETSRLQFDAVLENMSQGLTLFNRDRKLVVCNDRFADMYRLSSDQTRPGTSFADIVKYRVAAGSFLKMAPEAYLDRAKNLVAAANSFELVNALSDNRTVFVHSQPLPGGGWVSTHEDITERRRSEAAIAFMARHDALTKLPNRTLFEERMIEAIASTRRGGHCALLCLDLDRFKVVNDTLGHPAGDGLLRAVAARLLEAVREGDTVARLGGDEFAIILSNLKSRDDAVALAERVLSAFREAYVVDGHRIMAGTSIGVSLAPLDGNQPDILLKNADIALYTAKEQGRGTYRFFEPDVDSDIRQRRELELDLRNASPTRDFILHYQPVLDLQSGKVTGFEALIRWQHSERGMVSPADFIPIAEESGLIVPIGAWALRTACQEAAAWPDEIEIAVNLSPVQFRRGHLIDVVRDALTASGLAPHRLELEITESTLLENNGDSLALLHQLRALGIRIALDDFGTGYSSLSYLRSFPFDKIKIDRSFIRDFGTSKDTAVIVDAVVSIANSLGMMTVAEGVETMEQLRKVHEHGCTRVQGYLLSRPRPAADIPEIIRTLRVPDRRLNEVDTQAEAENVV